MSLIPRSAYSGYPTYWALSAGAQNIQTHQLFIKYSFTAIGSVDSATLKADIASMPYDTENAPILAYLLSLLAAFEAVQ
tara:strand:+ start:72 stop:308 length:237 start_codon:yes stop_codon:yes gene_type:complete